MHIDLSGRLAIVTGGAGQLGRVMVRTLARCGADVAVHYHRSADKAAELAAEVRAMGRRSLAVSADIGSREAVAAMRDTVSRELGEVDIVVNNAVAQYPWKAVLDQGVEDFESQFRSCVLQNVLMAQAFVPSMAARGWGRVIAINTECAMQCGPSQGAYVSGKRGMDGVLRVLAKEIGHANVTVNQVAPGWTISDRDRDAGSERQPDYDKHVPLRRRGEDQDIANAVAFLASDLAKFISGVYLPVCGGNVMPTI
ncbi:MAG: SDR family oxidoreductase [Phycisphaerae bacterium]|nr:SDR family oxidoreductase [Phycisphaerae bacterium]